MQWRQEQFRSIQHRLEDQIIFLFRCIFPPHYSKQTDALIIPVWKYLSLWGSSLNKQQIFSRRLIVAHSLITWFTKTEIFGPLLVFLICVFSHYFQNLAIYFFGMPFWTKQWNSIFFFGTQNFPSLFRILGLTSPHCRVSRTVELVLKESPTVSIWWLKQRAWWSICQPRLTPWADDMLSR